MGVLASIGRWKAMLGLVLGSAFALMLVGIALYYIIKRHAYNKGLVVLFLAVLLLLFCGLTYYFVSSSNTVAEYETAEMVHGIIT